MAKPLWEGYSWIFISAGIIPAFVPAPLAVPAESPTGLRAAWARSLQPIPWNTEDGMLLIQLFHTHSLPGSLGEDGEYVRGKRG